MPIPDQEIKDSFSSFETNGKLPKRKVASALRALNIPVTEAEVNGYIANIKDVAIDLSTFQKIVTQAENVQRPSLKETIDNVSALFRTPDGKINLADLKSVLSAVSERLSDELLDDFLATANIDSNGFLSVAELERLFA